MFSWVSEAPQLKSVSGEAVQSREVPNAEVANSQVLWGSWLRPLAAHWSGVGQRLMLHGVRRACPFGHLWPGPWACGVDPCRLCCPGMPERIWLWATPQCPPASRGPATTPAGVGPEALGRPWSGVEDRGAQGAGAHPPCLCGPGDSQLGSCTPSILSAELWSHGLSFLSPAFVTKKYTYTMHTRGDPQNTRVNFWKAGPL